MRAKPLVILLATSALVLTGCGGPSTVAEDPTTSASEPSTPSEVPVETAASEQIAEDTGASLLDSCLALFGDKPILNDAAEFLGDVGSLDYKTAIEAESHDTRIQRVAVRAEDELADHLVETQVVLQDLVQAWDDAEDTRALDFDSFNTARAEIVEICNPELEDAGEETAAVVNVQAEADARAAKEAADKAAQAEAEAEAEAAQDKAEAEAKAARDEAEAEAKAAAEAEAAAAEIEAATVSQKNALRHAVRYLENSAFSRSGLIDQLIYEKYSAEDATWAADRVIVDWNEQAAEHAARYLKNSAFSRQGLVDQLLYEGYTPEQAEYGVSQTGL